MKVICQLCGTECENTYKLSYHKRSFHKEITSKQYYDKYLKSKDEGKCKTCASDTSYLNMVKGYNRICSSRKCSGKYFSKRLREDTEKFNSFIETVSINQKEIWENRRANGEYKIIFTKISNTMAENNSKLSDLEKQKRYSRYYTCSPEKIEELNEMARKQCMKNLKSRKSGYKSNMKGKFKPKNPEKYMGNVKNIIFRSSWEFKYLRELDSDPDVLGYNSEEVIIPYISPKDNRIHRYFTDMYVERKVDNKIVKQIIEIKPKSQTIPPKKGNKTPKKFLNEVMTFGINQAKWEAAKSFCENNGMEFIILTEKELKIK